MSLGGPARGLFASATFLAACSSAPVEPGTITQYPYALASIDCGPLDGPAVSIYLGVTDATTPDPQLPNLHISIYDELSRVAERTFAWPGGNANARRCAGMGRCDAVPAGIVELGPVRPDSSIDVTVDLRPSTGERILGRVRARWWSRPSLLCG